MADVRHRKKETLRNKTERLLAHAQESLSGRVNKAPKVDPALIEEAIKAGKFTKCKASKRRPHIRKRHTGN